jgi:hypothetical protein
VQHAPPTPLQQHRPFQPQREQNMISTSSAFPSPGLMHDGKATGSRSNQSTSVAASTPGHMQLVVPPGEQKTWYGTGWARLKHAVLGSAAAPDLLELGPPWTKWPGGGREGSLCCSSLVAQAAIRSGTFLRHVLHETSHEDA